MAYRKRPSKIHKRPQRRTFGTVGTPPADGKYPLKNRLRIQSWSDPIVYSTAWSSEQQ
jgi:hypothetical protein